MAKGVKTDNCLNHEIRTDLGRKRLVFTVTTGRSGTGYLAELLRLLPGITSHHETKPEFVEALRQAQTHPPSAAEFWLERKLPQIAQAPHRIYIETSHLVCKGFLEPLLEIGIVPDLILLSRPRREVALSLLQLNTIPGRTEKALKFYLSPDAPGVLPLPGWHGLQDYQLCYWYCLEIERRSHQYAKLFGEYGSKIVETSLSDLKTCKGIYRLLDGLALPRLSPSFWARYFRSRGRKINTKDTMKEKIQLPENYLDLEMEVDQIVGLESLAVPISSTRVER